MKWVLIALVAVYFAGWVATVMIAGLTESAAAAGDFWLVVGEYTTREAWLWPLHLYRSLFGG